MLEIVLRDPMASEVQRTAEAEGVDAETLVELAWKQFQWEQRLRKIGTEVEWWRKAPPELRERYKGKYVAVHNQKIVDDDADEATLHRRIRQRFGFQAVLLTPASGRPALIFRSPRLEGVAR